MSWTDVLGRFGIAIAWLGAAAAAFLLLGVIELVLMIGGSALVMRIADRICGKAGDSR